MVHNKINDILGVGNLGGTLLIFRASLIDYVLEKMASIK